MLYKLNILLNIIIIIMFLLFTNISLSQTKHHLDNEQRIIIPISFHIVENNKNREKVEIKERHDTINKRINILIHKINEGFNFVNEYKIESEYHNDIANCKIHFKFINNKKITFHNTTIKAFDISNKLHNLNLKKLGYLNSNKVLNVWVCKLDTIKTPYGNVINGYSTFPKEQDDKIDGVIISFEALFATDLNAMTSITIHEIGHWLGLKHIWGNDTIGIPDCLSDDGINDTPKQKKPHKHKTTPYKSDDIQNVCFPLLTEHIKTNYQNFMDYSYVYGMFTKGQAIEMRKNIFKYRKELLSSNNVGVFAKYQKMTAEIFNYYVLSSNNLDYKNNDIYLKSFIKQIQKINPKSEFELKIMKVEAIKKIENGIVNFNTRYKKSNYVDFLREYDFDNKYFPFKVNIVLWDWKGSYQLKYFSELDKYQNFRLYAINSDDFDKIEISDKNAEKLISSTNQRRVYPQIEYSTLKLSVKNSKGKLVGMLAHIDHIKIFSDMRRTKLIHTIYAKTNKETYQKYNYAIWNDVINKFQLY